MTSWEANGTEHVLTYFNINNINYQYLWPSIQSKSVSKNYYHVYYYKNNYRRNDNKNVANI